MKLLILLFLGATLWLLCWPLVLLVLLLWPVVRAAGARRRSCHSATLPPLTSPRRTPDPLACAGDCH